MAALIIRKMKPSVIRRLFGDKTSAAKSTHGTHGKKVERNCCNILSNCKEFFSKKNTVSPKSNEAGMTVDDGNPSQNTNNVNQVETSTRNQQSDVESEEEITKMFSVRDDLIKEGHEFNKTINALLDCLKEEVDDGFHTLYVKLLEEDEEGNEPRDQNFNSKDHTILQKFAEDDKKDEINHPVVRYLLKHKWKKWAKYRLILNFVLYVLSLVSLSFGAGYAVIAADVKTFDTSDGLQLARLVFELIAYVFVLKALFSELYQLRKHPKHYFKQSLNLLELLSALLLVAVLPLRFLHLQAHWIVYACGYLLWVLRIFKYSVVFSPFGAYAETLRQIITRDVRQFISLFLVINLAFGGTFLLVLKGEGSLDAHDETSTFSGILLIGLRTMIEAGPVVEYTEGYKKPGFVVMLVFMGFTIVILLNILIAQLSETYHSVQSDSMKSVYVNRAWIVARLEQNEHQLFNWKMCLGNRTKYYESTLTGVKLKTYDWKDSTQLDDLKNLILESENRQMQFNSKMQTMIRACEKQLEEMKIEIRSGKIRHTSE